MISVLFEAYDGSVGDNAITLSQAQVITGDKVEAIQLAGKKRIVFFPGGEGGLSPQTPGFASLESPPPRSPL
jgi:hypothetical protein